MSSLEYRKMESGVPARRKLIAGVNALANAVKSTLGPNGRTVLMERGMKPPEATKDGVTVAQDIFLGEHVANLAAQVIKEAANNANALVGDGTTTATVMVQALFQELNAIQDEMAIPDLQAGMEYAKQMILEEIQKMSVQIHDHKERAKYLRQIAVISSNNDSEIPDKVMEAFEYIGDKGALKVDMGRLHHTIVTKSEGLSYNCGMTHTIFATNDKKTIANLNNPLIFLTNHTLDYVPDIEHILDYARKNERSILIIAGDYTDAAQTAFYRVKDVYKVKVCCVKAPGFGNQQQDIMEDIETLVGAKAIIKGSGTDMEDVHDMSPEMVLGEAKKITVTFEDFTILDGKGGREAIDGRVEMLKEKMEEEEDGYLRDQLNGRIAKLVHGVAVIYVGAETELEAKEKMGRYVDAVKAVKSAVKSGIVPGGGLTLARSSAYAEARYNSEAFKMAANQEQMSDMFKKGFTAVLRSCMAPMRQILINAYLPHVKILKEVQKGKYEKGYNVRSKQYEDFLTSGVIDPAMVASVSLNNAVSIVSTLMSTDHVIYSYVGEPVDYEQIQL